MPIDECEPKKQSPYCPKCTGKRCGKYHVYVIELDHSVLNVKKFRRENSYSAINSPCYYVGSTKHTCECRYGQHASFYLGDDSYVCRCDGTMKEINFYHAGGKTRGNKFAGKYAIGLRPDLFYHINPIKTKERVLQIEHELAIYLKEQGAAVWQR